MDLNLLPILAALFEAKSVSRAADLLNVTQPAVSRSLKRLRDHFRDPLFVRGRGGLMPTARASEIQPVLFGMLGGLEGLLAPAEFDPKTLVREFVLMGSDYCDNVLLPPILRALRGRAPGVTLRLMSITETMWDHLEQGKIDLIVLPEQNMRPHTRHRFLFQDPYVCLAAKKHPRIRGRLDLEAFCRVPHIQVKAKSTDVPARSPIDTILEKLGRTRTVAATVPTMFSVGRIVAESDLIATLPKRVADLAVATLPVRSHPLPIELWDVRIALGWHERSQADPGHKFFRDLVAETVGEKGTKRRSRLPGGTLPPSPRFIHHPGSEPSSIQSRLPLTLESWQHPRENT
jgi:DNA-binding transcriptional LysR family regulator